MKDACGKGPPEKMLPFWGTPHTGPWSDQYYAFPHTDERWIQQRSALPTQYFPIPLTSYYFRHSPIFKHETILIFSVFAEIISAVLSCHSEDDVLTLINTIVVPIPQARIIDHTLLVTSAAFTAVYWPSKLILLSMIDDQYYGRKIISSGDYRIQHEYKPQPKEYRHRNIPIHMKYQRVMKRRRDGRLWLT